MHYLFEDRVVNAEEITDVGIGVDKGGATIGYALSFKSGSEEIYHAEKLSDIIPSIGDFYIHEQEQPIRFCPAGIFLKDYTLIEE